jgi:ABC-2 type transport system permease protein
VTIRRRTRAYARLALNAARTTFAYRLSFVLGTIGVTFQLVALVALWGALLRGGARLGGFSLLEMKGYLLVGYVTGVLTSGFGEQAMAERIRSGAVALDLVKPLSYAGMRFAEVLGGVGVELGLIAGVGTAFMVLAGPVPAPVHPMLFLLALLAVLPIKFLLLYMSTLLCFWTQNYHGVAWARSALTLILSGALVPLALLPHWLRSVAAALPFAATTSTPALIYLGKIDTVGAVTLIAVQCGWIAGLWVASRVLWRGAVRQLTVHGG